MKPGPGETRPFRDADLEAVVRLWHETKQAAYPYLPLEQGRTLEEDERFFRERIRPLEIWVAEAAGEILGFLALRGSYLDRLYVRPGRQGAGVGTALERRAMERSPGGLELHTHVRNGAARAFYERHGFRAVRFGVSPPPESEPDVEYHWKP